MARGDDDALEEAEVEVEVGPQVVQVDQGVRQQLPGPVVRHLTATVQPQQRRGGGGGGQQGGGGGDVGAGERGKVGKTDVGEGGVAAQCVGDGGLAEDQHVLRLLLRAQLRADGVREARPLGWGEVGEGGEVGEEGVDGARVADTVGGEALLQQVRRHERGQAGQGEHAEDGTRVGEEWRGDGRRGGGGGRGCGGWRERGSIGEKWMWWDGERRRKRLAVADCLAHNAERGSGHRDLNTGAGLWYHAAAATSRTDCPHLHDDIGARRALCLLMRDAGNDGAALGQGKPRCPVFVMQCVMKSGMNARCPVGLGLLSSTQAVHCWHRSVRRALQRKLSLP